MQIENRFTLPRTIIVAGMMVFVFLFTSCDYGGQEQKKQPIRFAFQNRVGSAIPIVAVKKGFFEKSGIVIQPLRFNSGPACAEALYSGSADIGTMGDTTAIIAGVQNARLKIIASHSTGEHRHRIIVRDSSPLQRFEDLRGSRIAVKKGTSTFGGLLASLASNNISLEDVVFVDLSPSIMPDALMAGSIDAFAASEPTPSLAELRGGRELGTLGGLGNEYPIMMLAQKDLLDERDEDVIRFLQALKNAETFVLENPEETAMILVEVTGLTPEVARYAMTKHSYRLRLDEAIMESLNKTAEFLKDQKIISAIPDFPSVITTRYIQ